MNDCGECFGCSDNDCDGVVSADDCDDVGDYFVIRKMSTAL